MSFSVTIPSETADRFDAAVDMVLAREASALKAARATHAADLAATAVKQLVKSWETAKDKERTFGAVISGHANPDGTAPEGFPNDEIHIRLWHSGRRAAVVKVEEPAPKTASPVVPPFGGTLRPSS